MFSGCTLSLCTILHCRTPHFPAIPHPNHGILLGRKSVSSFAVCIWNDIVSCILCVPSMCVVSQLLTTVTMLFSSPGIVQVVSAFLGICLVLVRPYHPCRSYVMQCILFLLNLIYDLECVYFPTLSAILLKSPSIILHLFHREWVSFVLLVSYHVLCIHSTTVCQ
jgi:hypothetical protein